MGAVEVPGISVDKKTLDNKLFVYQTVRPFGTLYHFTSEGDNPATNNAVGGGSLLKVSHAISDPLTQTQYVDFNTIENKSYLREGYMIWGDATFDMVTLDVVPKVTTCTPSTGTSFNLYGE